MRNLVTITLVLLSTIALSQPYQQKWGTDINTVIKYLNDNGITTKGADELPLHSRHLKDNQIGEIVVAGNGETIPMVFFHFTNDELRLIREVLPLRQWSMYKQMHQGSKNATLPGPDNQCIIRLEKHSTYFVVVYTPTDLP